MSQVAAVVLAAGGSARLGDAKQLLPYRGRALVRHAAEVAVEAGCHPTIVVLGANADACSTELRGLPVEMAVNPSWSTGIASSIHVGLDAIQRCGTPVDAVLFTLCDQPHVSSGILREILQRRADCGARIVASAYEGTLGVPALFAKELIPQLLALHGDEGARRVIAAHGDEVVAIANRGAAFDIDTPADRGRMAADS